MPQTQETDTPARVADALGRTLPRTAEEVRARAEEIARGLEALDAIGDEEEQRRTLEALMTGLREDRLSFGERPDGCD